MSNTYWRQLALDKWPGVPINGVGRWALKNERTGEIFLYLTEGDADRSGAFHNSRTYDLQPCPQVPNCPDRFYED